MRMDVNPCTPMAAALCADTERRSAPPTRTGRRARRALCALAAAAMLAANLAFASSIANAREVFISPGLGFSIEFPVSPHSMSGELKMASGPAQYVRFTAAAGRLQAAVNVVVFNRGPFTPDEIASGLAQSRDRQVALVYGRLVREFDIALEGHPGKELLISFGPPEQDFHYRVRSYYVGNRQFLVSVIGSADDVFSAAADAYFNSFALVY